MSGEKTESWCAEYPALGIALDFSNEGYKGRLARIRALDAEGKGPLAEMREFHAKCVAADRRARRPLPPKWEPKR
jgi:hypothetical protein